MSKLYTGKGDDGTTGLFFGGRVPKAADRPEAYGTVDEAQSFIGLARAALDQSTPTGAELNDLLVRVERDLYVLMAELATLPANAHKLVPEQSSVSVAMVDAIAAATDDIGGRFAFPTEFVVPGQSEVSARLDVARAVVRRAERRAVVVDLADFPDGTDAQVVPYLNRLSSLLWTLARFVEADHTLLAKETP